MTKQKLETTAQNTIIHAEELDVAKWKETIAGLGEIAYKAYFAEDSPIAWSHLSRGIRAKWQLVGLALAEKLCPHDDKTITSAGNIWCNKCGWQIPKERL